jgi:hypothetical protein
MASFQIFFREYLEDKLNTQQNNLLTPVNLKYKIYNRYGVDEQEFFDVVVDSVDWEESPSTIPSANNVVIDVDGEEYNTQNGQYTLRKVRYIPAIIEDFIAEFEPLDFVKNANYTIPITFYVNETIDRQLNNVIVDAIQNFQDTIRGKIDTYFDSNAGVDFTFLVTHGGYSPLTGIIDFNGTVFREYQLILSLELIDKGFFANQIEYVLSVPEYQGVSPTVDRFAELGTAFRVYPVAAMSSRASELHQFQKFSTSSNDEFEVKALANEVGFMVELSFLYDGSLFTRWLYKLRYTPSVPKVVTLQVRYPGLTSNLEIAPATDYIIESIGGIETVGEKILLSLVLKPVEPIQSQISVSPVDPPIVTQPEEPNEPTPPTEPEPTPVTSTTFNITVQNVNGTNVFFVNGQERPVLSLLTNNVYVFNQSDASNATHQIGFRGVSDIPYTQGVVTTGTPGQEGAQTVFTVPFNVPSNLRYYCVVHGNAMGNTITMGIG